MTENKPEEKPRLTKAHGGETVELIKPDELVSFNDADCTHKMATRIEDDGDFAVFACTNPRCNEVVLYNKN